MTDRRVAAGVAPSADLTSFCYFRTRELNANTTAHAYRRNQPRFTAPARVSAASPAIFFRGRHGSRTVLSNPSFATVAAVHLASPNGRPRLTLVWSSPSSSSPSPPLTTRVQFPGRSTGHGESRSLTPSAPAAPPRLDHGPRQRCQTRLPCDPPPHPARHVRRRQIVAVPEL